MTYLIIGGGIAGTTAAEDLRKIDPDATITIISNEQHPLYSRVLLPHYIKGKVPRERVFLKSKDWYKEQHIDLVFDEVAGIRTQDKIVMCTSGKPYTYDKLLIAGGGIVNKLPYSDIEHTHHLQTIEDADGILAAINSRKDEQTHAHVIGAGFIAMEFVELFAEAGFETHMYVRGERCFSRIFDHASSDILVRHLSSHGVTVCTTTSCTAVDNTTITTSHGESATCDLLGIGVGIASSFSWAQEAGIDVASGVLANEYLETNIADIYTAGDCAEYLDVITGRQIHVGNWMNALMQGRHVAKIMTGTREPFRLVSSYATHVLGLDIVAIGDARQDKADTVIARGDNTSRTQLMLSDNCLVGATLINRNTERAPITQLIDRRVDIAQHRENLSDPAFDLKQLL